MANKANHLKVSEQFFSIQGEGQTIGRPSYFLRLTACNLMCGGLGTQKDGELHNGATWRCDSIESWIKGKSKHYDQIIKDFGGKKFIENLELGAHLIITGGEPLLQQAEITDFLFYIRKHGVSPMVEIETNGTIEPNKMLEVLVKYWNVSPKISNSGETERRRFKPFVLKAFNRLPGTIFKYVVGGSADMGEIKKDIEHCDLNPIKIWLMPAGSTQAQLALTAPMVAEYCKEFMFNYSHRVHVAIWDKALGV